MKYKNVEYINADKQFESIKTFLTKLQYVKNHDNNWDPSRFDWWRYSYHYDKDETFFRSNCHYWTTENDSIVAVAISEYGKNDIFIVVDPDHKVLYGDVIKWCRDVFGNGKTEIISPIFLVDAYKIEKLEENGFNKSKHENNVRTYDLANYKFDYELAKGYRLMNFSDYRDFESKSELICSAFSKKEHPVSRIEPFMNTPGYMTDLDLIIVNENQKAVAYCTGWLEQYDDSLGYIEPMGVHEDYRRLGFGTVLAKECFKRLLEKGVKYATIASNAEPDISNLLYDSLKPIEKKSGYEFVLKLRD